MIPAVTGSGKTLCYRWYAAQLAWESQGGANKSPGMLIVTTLKTETEESVQMINEWAGDQVAVAYNSDSDIKAFNQEHLLDKHQIVVIQHEYFKRHHHLRSSSKSAYKQIMSYQGSERELIVIDEAIQLIEPIEISKYTLSKTVGWLAEHKEILSDELEVADYLRDNFEKLFDLSETPNVEYVGKSKLMLGRLCANLNMPAKKVEGVLQMMRAIDHLKTDPDLYSQGFNNPRGGSINKYLRDLKYIFSEDLYKYKEGSKLEYRSSTLELPLKSLVVLDATAKVDKTYDHFPNAKVVDVPRVKSYANVALNVYMVEGGVGNEVICTNWDRSTSNIEELRDLAEFRGEETVVFSFKKLARYIGDGCDNFGNLAGVNRYKNCTEMVIYGLYFRPNYMYYDYLYQGSNKSPEVFSDKVRVKNLKYSHIAADVIQMINRGCCRRIVDGKAPKMKVSILLPKGRQQISDAILDSIRSEMNDISINVIEAQFTTKDSERKHDGNIVESDKALLSTLRGCSNPKVKLSELLDELGLTKRKKERVRGYLNKPECSNTYLALEVGKLGYKVIKEQRQLFLVRVDGAK